MGIERTTKAQILFIDDEPKVLDSIRRSLRRSRMGWEFFSSNSVDQGLMEAERIQPDLIVTDMSMPGKSGLDLIRGVRSMPELSATPIIMLTGDADVDLKRKALDLGALDLINKPMKQDDLIARIASALRLRFAELELREMNQRLEEIVTERTADLEFSRYEIVWRLAKAGQLRDGDTGEHLYRVAMISKVIALHVGFSDTEADDLFYASALHDIGKIGIPDSILLKQGKLTDAEREQNEQHCVLGHRILSDDLDVPSARKARNPLLGAAAEIAMAHHERWDGDGYPNGISGTDIPHVARIVAVADVMDALCSVRPYKPAMNPGVALRQIKQSTGSHFDPSVVSALESVFESVEKLYTDTPTALASEKDAA
jgi:putative two-component system response regulator